MSPSEKAAIEYNDVLQNPLQPYKDNLRSFSYMAFEDDEIKYELYEEAVFRYLFNTKKEVKTIIYLIGAGRGPLIKRSF